MDGLHLFISLVTFAGVVAGATWALRTKLSDIEVALKGHVTQDEEVHKDQGARILKLEGRRKR